jgi:hypothetical protein
LSPFNNSVMVIHNHNRSLADTTLIEILAEEVILRCYPAHVHMSRVLSREDPYTTEVLIDESNISLPIDSAPETAGTDITFGLLSGMAGGIILESIRKQSVYSLINLYLLLK